MLRLFGETADSSASFSAQSGDRISESPLHELALRVGPADSQSSNSVTRTASAPRIALANLSDPAPSYLARAADEGLISTDLHFAPSAQAVLPQAGPDVAPDGLYTVAYQPVAPVPRISPDPGVLAFDNATTQALPAVNDTPLKFGSEPGAKRGLNLSVSGDYEHTTPNDIAGLSAAPVTIPSWQLPSGNSVTTAPNFGGTNQLSLNAGLAVPVFHGVTLNLNYDAQRSYGGYVLPGLQNLDAANNSYVGRLTYNIPYSSSTLSISAYQNRFGESVLPVNGYTQTGEDVNFTVKF